VHPEVCGPETTICPFSYVAVIEEAPHEHSCCAPAEPTHAATTKAVAATVISFARLCTLTPSRFLFLINAADELEGSRGARP
jgi:hypothetical protein